MGYSITKHLSSRIIIVLLPVILAVILSCIFVFYFMGKINIERNAFQALDMKALGFKAQVENWDQLMCRIGKGITYNNHVQNLNSQITTEVLKATFLANKDYISTCFLFDFQGYVSAMGHSAVPDTQSRANRNYFRSAMAGVAVARESIFSMSTKKPAVAFAFPVYNPLGLTDKPQAVIAIVTNLSNLSQLAIQNKVGQTGISFVVDDQGIVLGHPDDKLVSGDKLSSLSDYPPVKAALAGRIGAMEFKDSSQNELFSISSRLSNGWYTVVTQKKTEVFAGMGELTTAVIAAGTTIILILILFLFFVINHATKPLILLSSLIEEMGKGNFLATSKVNIKKLSKRKDEMGSMARAVSKLETYMSEKQKILETIAQGAGDFTIQVDVASEEDLFSLKLQEMLNSLNCIILDVKRSAQEISKGSQQISQATQLLSQGTTQQAAAMEEITATTSEILGQTKQNAQDAEHAQEYSQQNQAIAQESSVSAKSLNEAMQGISQSSDQIQKIMKLINDIAFQTNLLSLNASIEAAKAGKYGRGFNVVAQEVRDLARKSSEAVNNTSQVIEESVSRTAQGDQEVKNVLKQLNSMVEKTQQVADKVQQIAAASLKQTSSIQEINQGLDQISLVTQNTTASTEEISSNAQELAQQAQMLLELVEQFHLKE